MSVAVASYWVRIIWIENRSLAASSLREVSGILENLNLFDFEVLTIGAHFEVRKPVSYERRGVTDTYTQRLP